MALEESNYDHLVELGDSDYELTEGETDIVGWDVKDEQGQKVGEVDELLFDPESGQVRYLVVDLDDNDFELDEDKKILIPIGVVDLYNGEDEDEDDDLAEDGEEGVYATEESEEKVYDPYDDGEVVIAPVTAEKLRTLPAYEKGSLSPQTEASIRQIFEGNTGLTGEHYDYDRNSFYEHAHFNTDRYYDRGATMQSIVPEADELDLDEPLAGGTASPSANFENETREREISPASLDEPLGQGEPASTGLGESSRAEEPHYGESIGSGGPTPTHLNNNILEDNAPGSHASGKGEVIENSDYDREDIDKDKHIL